jgi:hypothetical protein
MDRDRRQPQPEPDPKAGLSPWMIGVALGGASAVWLIVKLLDRVL